MQKKQKQQFKLEGLEPRLLLSADASAVAADFATDLEHIPVLVEKLQSDQLNHQMPLVGQNLANISNPSEQLQDLFSGLTDSNIDTPENLITALDSEPGVDAALVEKTDTGFTLDLGVSDIFEGVVTLDVEPQDSGSLDPSYREDLSLNGHIRLTGDWDLNLRIVADSDNENIEFAIDSALSFLRMNVEASDAILATGWYDGVAVDRISDLHFQASFDTKFAYDVSLFNLSQTGGNGLDLATTTSMVGHAALTLQMVESLNTAHGPPTVSLSWDNANFHAEPITNQYVTSGTGLLENNGLGVDGFLLPKLNDQISAIESFGTIRFNEDLNDFTDSLNPADNLRTEFVEQALGFTNRAERVFDGLDPPTSVTFLPDLSDSSNSTEADPAPFEFVIASNSASDLTLRLNGEHVEIVDNLAGILLARQALSQTSEIIIHGVDNVDDTLTVDFSNGL
ncbi:MAG: LEPR-XLL domain-containing protein, partial [Candidatus Latescibacteria bacterium]|nr:LEPR-XLL domain-containing protein [Candidatus Latescibacterota bacterium]